MFQTNEKTPEFEPSAAKRMRSSPELVFLIIAALLIAAYLLRYVLLPFVVAGALAYVAMPVVGLLHQRLGWPRWVAAVGLFLFYLSVLILIGLGLVRLAIPQLAAVTADLPNTLHRFLTIAFKDETLRLPGASLNATQLSRELSVWRPGSNPGSMNANDLIDTGGTAVALAMGILLTLVLLLYFLLEGPRLARGAMWLAPPAFRPRVRSIASQAGPVLYRYIAGVFVVVFYTIALTWLFARVWLGLPNAELLAVAVGLLELVPVAGPVLSVLMIALIAIEQLTFGKILAVSIFATVLRLSIDQFVGPIVLGKATRLSPPVIIFAFLAGGAIYGALGVLIAIPALAVGKIVFQELYGDQDIPPM